MKLSTRLMRYVGADLLGLHDDWNTTDRTIVLMSKDGKHSHPTNSLFYADRLHECFLSDGYKLELDDCPVVNGKNECIMWYTNGSEKDIKIGKKEVQYNAGKSDNVIRVVRYSPRYKKYFCDLYGYAAEVKQIDGNTDAVSGWYTTDSWEF